MSHLYSENQTVATVSRLTVTRLRRLVASDCVRPRESGGALVFSDADIARLELLLELGEDFDIDEDALSMVMSLIDQLHGLRHELRALGNAVSDQPREVRTLVRKAYHLRRGG
jgi:chaperone modulatory protein CbpM